jgi:hypothetical protein
MKATVVTTAITKEVAEEICEEMKSLTGFDFSHEEVSGFTNNETYFIIRGEVDDVVYSQSNIKDEFLVTSPNDEWVAKFGKEMHLIFSRREHSLNFYHKYFDYDGELYEIEMSGEDENSLQLEHPERMARISRI